MKIYRFDKFHPNVDLDRLIRYDSFRINYEIQWIGNRCILDKLMTFDDVTEYDDIEFALSLPTFTFFIEYHNSLFISKMESFKCM